MLRVFEAFAGYGSQRMALRNTGIPYEIVGISEIEGNVLLSYAAIHTGFLKLRNDPAVCPETEEEMRKYLLERNVPLDYKNFQNRAENLKGRELKDMYLANKLSKNFGDIRTIDPGQLPDFDLFTYSFPCQDISVAGYQYGLKENSGTRSSLLWECCKIIEKKKPPYLMMENVKNLVGKNHIRNFSKFLNYLESIGYRNFWSVLNAKDYGVPQNRERVFCISMLDPKAEYIFPEKTELKKTMKDYLERDVSKSFYLRCLSDIPIDQDVCYCIDSNYWKGSTIENFFEKRRRQLITTRQTENGKYLIRRLTPKETWRLMGCSDEDFEKAASLNSNTNLYRQAGNSIVVPVLEAVFEALFKSGKDDCRKTARGHQYSLL